jgi:hypothetical protein
LIEDKGYPIITWIMIPYKEEGWNIQFLNWFIIENINTCVMWLKMFLGFLKKHSRSSLGNDNYM